MSTDNRFGYVRVATACPKLRVADPAYNAEQHVLLMQEAAAQDVDVLLFTEHSVTAYTCGDLFGQSTLLHGALDALSVILTASAKARNLGLVIVGLPLQIDGLLFNTAAVISRGKILGIVPKTFPPNYREFYEGRWFASAAAAHSTEVQLFADDEHGAIPFGTDLLFADRLNEGLVVGVEICEDLWVPEPPSGKLAICGATLITNLSASNFTVDKPEYRRRLVTNQSARCIAAYAYASSGPDESTTDIVFDGHCIIADNGEIISESPRFQQWGYLRWADIDTQRLLHDRSSSNSFCHSSLNSRLRPKFRRIFFEIHQRSKPLKLLRKINPFPFVPQNKAELTDTCQDIFKAQVAGLRKRLSAVSGDSIIGVSGGLDSTLALIVACKAFTDLSFPLSRIHGYTLPGFGTTSKTKNNAHTLMQVLGVTSEEVDIRLLCLEQFFAMGHKPFGIDLQEFRQQVVTFEGRRDLGAALDDYNQVLLANFQNALSRIPKGASDLTFENVQARVRTLFLMSKGFVIGTGDLSELALGWCTYNADHMSMYNPNCSIPKTLVKFLVEWAAQNEFEGEARDVLMSIAGTIISPELLPTAEDGSIAQSTEDHLGSYDVHDFILYHCVRGGKGPEEIYYLLRQTELYEKYGKEKLVKWLEVFFKRFFSQQFKRSCVPDGPKVGSVSLSPRGDWRMPSDASAALWLNEVSRLESLALVLR